MQHKFRISWGNVERGEVGEDRFTYDCMQSHRVRARCTSLLKKLLKSAPRDEVWYVRFSNDTIGVSDRIAGYNGRIARKWDE